MTKQEINPIYEKLIAHVGHNIEVVTYGSGEPISVAIECVDCHEVLCEAEKYDETERDMDDLGEAVASPSLHCLHRL